MLSISLYSLIILLLSLGVSFLLVSSLQYAQEQGISYSSTKQRGVGVRHTRKRDFIIYSLASWMDLPGDGDTYVQLPISSSSATPCVFSFSSWQWGPYSGMFNCSSPKFEKSQDFSSVPVLQAMAGADDSSGGSCSLLISSSARDVYLGVLSLVLPSSPSI